MYKSSLRSEGMVPEGAIPFFCFGSYPFLIGTSAEIGVKFLVFSQGLTASRRRLRSA